MKRFLCSLLILCLLPIFAYAETVESMVNIHNRYCGICSASEITGEPEIQKNGDYSYKITDSINIDFSVKDGNVSSLACVCFSESGISEFLAQCVSLCYSIGGISSGIYSYGPVLSDFLAARSGKNPETNKNVPGLIFSLTKESFGYAFIAVGVN